MDKQVYDLKPEDLQRHPLWFFPMDETVTDELTVRAVVEGAAPPEDLQAIAACEFHDELGREFSGYAYLGSSRVDHAKPLLWINGEAVTFWNGADDPLGDSLRVSALLPAGSWPIRYRSRAGVPPVSGTLEGLYFVNYSSREVACRRVGGG